MIPPWARGKMLRAAFGAGLLYGGGATRDEVKRGVDVCLGETGATVAVRDARKNSIKLGHRWADAGLWQVSLMHFHAKILGTPPAQLIATLEELTRGLLDLREAAKRTLSHLRLGSAFHSEAAVRDGVGVQGRLLKEMSDAVMVEVDRLIVGQAQPLAGVVLFE